MVGRAIFPDTHLSALLRARSDDASARERAWREVAAVYRRPVYLHLRVKWRCTPERAEDLTQDFFVYALQRDVLARFEPQRGRFRTFVRVCVDRLVLNELQAGQRIKRGGQQRRLQLDVHELEQVLRTHAPAPADRVFEVAWARSVLQESVKRLGEQLTAEGRGHQFQAFSLYDLADDPISYQELASSLGVQVTDVTNYLSAARRRFRQVTLETLRELTATREEFEAEVLALCGAPTLGALAS